MSACLCTHSYHEIFNFTSVQRTLKLMYISLTVQKKLESKQKKKLETHQMTDR